MKRIPLMISLCVAALLALVAFVPSGSTSSSLPISGKSVAKPLDNSPVNESEPIAVSVPKLAGIGDRLKLESSPQRSVSQQIQSSDKNPDPLNSVVINSTIDLGDPTFMRPSAAGAAGGVPTCPVSGNPVVHYETREYVVTGCASPVVTVDTCATASGLNTVLYLYQKVGGGTGGIFDPASPCTNAVNSNNNNATTCGAGSTLSALSSTLTPGNFVVAIATNGAGETGAYNLNVGTVTAGCTVSQFTGCTYSLSPSSNTVCSC